MSGIFKKPNYSMPEPIKVDPAATHITSTHDDNIRQETEKKKKRYGFAKTVGSVTGGETLGV